jgi:hypothetical protein
MISNKISHRITIIFFELLASLAQLTISQGRGINIISYDIDATIAAHTGAVDITATCLMQKTDTTSQSELLLSSNSKLQAVLSFTNGCWSEIPFQFSGKDTLQLHFPLTMRQADSLTIKFRYTFPINSLGDSLLLLDRGSRWYPLIIDQIAAMRLRCEVPREYTVLSAGDLLEMKVSGTTSQFIWETKLPIFKLPLVVFKSSSLKKDTNQFLQKKIVLYSSAAGTLPSTSILAEAKNAFIFFTNTIGRYPYKCLTLVEVPYFDGTDISSGLLMVGSSSFREMGTGDFDALRLTVAEQWIGAGVFAKFHQPGFWFLTISLPQYLRLMYIRHKEGEEAFNKALHEPLKQYERFAGKENDVPILDVDYPNTKEKGLVLYGKGPFVISKLHTQLGDDQWKAFLHDLYKEFLGKILTYGEFRTYVSKHDKSGTGLTLLNKLVTQKGIPKE